MTFQPLTMQRAIRDDTALTAPEKGLLLVAVLRTDNQTRQVKASMQRLAEDAGLGYRTARRVFGPGNARVMRYFDSVERGARRVNLTFHPTDDLQTVLDEAAVAGSDVALGLTRVATLSSKAVAVAESPGQGGHPSAPTHATSSASEYSKEWIEANAPSFDDDLGEVNESPSRPSQAPPEPPSSNRSAGPRSPLPADRPPQGYIRRLG